MWLNLLMDDRHLSNITKIRKKIFLFNHIFKKKLAIIKKWTYTLHNKNDIIEKLMKAFFNSY